MRDRANDIFSGQPRLRALFTILIGAMILKLVARYGWSYRLPRLLDLGIVIAILAVLLYAARRSRWVRVD